MKRVIICAFIAFFFIQLNFGQPKVAVLDASLGQGVHINASSIVADTINEQFVKSPYYITIDRAYISNIQAEKQFQLSGEVNDNDIKELGVTFGADYLCIANVSLLGSTYTVSARLIEVESAEVVAQESDRRQGEIDILFEIAEVVGGKFVGIMPEPKPEPELKPEPEPEPEPVVIAPAPRPGPTPAPAKWSPKSRISFGYLFPAYLGAEDFFVYNGNNYSFYEMDQYFFDIGAFDAGNVAWGIDMHFIVPLGFLYAGGGLRFSDITVTSEDDYGDRYEYEMASVIDLVGSAGVVYSPISNLQLYAGANVGLMVFIVGSNYDGEATVPFFIQEGETASGMCFGFEAGADYFLGGLCLSVKYKFCIAPDLTGDAIFTDEFQDASGDTSCGLHGFSIGAGYSF